MNFSTPAFLTLGLLGAFLLPPQGTHAADNPQRAASSAAPVSSSGADLLFKNWSAPINVPDPVACSVDPKGRVYVSSTARRKVADLDIRENSAWIPDDVGL